MFGFGSWRLKVYLAIFAIGTLVTGFISLGQSMRFRSATKVSYAQFVAEKPQEGWYDVSGGYLDLSNAVLSGESNGYFVPLRADGESQESDVRVLVSVTDEKTVRQIDAFNNAAHKPATLWGTSHWSQLGSPPNSTILETNVSGLVNHSVHPDSDEGHKLEEEVKSSGDLTTIDMNVHPNALLAIGMIIAGGFLALLSLLSFGIQIDPAGIKETLNAQKAARGPDLLRNPGAPGTGPYGHGAPPPLYPGQQQGYQSPPAQYPPPTPPMGAPPYGQPGGYQPQQPPPTAAPLPPAAPRDEAADKAAEELAKLREMKPFDPFG